MSVLIESSILHKQPGIRPELEAALYENKSSFTQLLKNPPRNEADASLLRKSTTEGMSTFITRVRKLDHRILIPDRNIL